MRVFETIYLYARNFYQSRGDRNPGLMGLLLISLLITFNLLTINWLPVIFRSMEEPIISRNLILPLFFVVLACVYYYICKVKSLNTEDSGEYLFEYSKTLKGIALLYCILSVLLFAATIIVGASLRDKTGYNL